MELMDGDILRVASSSNRKKNTVILRGAFVRPGNYGWFNGLRFSQIVDDFDADLKDNADLGIALIVRRISNTSNKIKVLSFDPSIAKDQPFSGNDPELESMDEIVILDQAINVNSEFQYYSA